MGKLTTHVLDTSLGRPGAGIALDVVRVDGEQREHVAKTVTNDDGRCDAPLLEGDALIAGEYEISFAVGAYLASTGVEAPSKGPRFLDNVVLRFGVSDASEHYHVPLLISPFAYSTYRGS